MDLPRRQTWSSQLEGGCVHVLSERIHPRPGDRHQTYMWTPVAVCSCVSEGEYLRLILHSASKVKTFLWRSEDILAGNYIFQ